MKILLLFVLGVSNLFAQSGNYMSATESDPKAIELLESIKHDFESYKAHKFDFTIDIEYPAHEGQKMSGSLIQSGDNFVLDVDERKIISDNKSVWVYLKERNEVQINDADFEEGDELMKPSDLFKLYNSRKYVFAITNYTKEAGEAITQLECKPLDEDSEYSKIRITAADKSKEIKRMKIFFKDGSRMTMSVTSQTKDFEPEAGTFSFDAKNHEGVLVEDLRF